MDWLNNMNRAMDHIEAHLEDDVDYDAIARAACCPAWLFQRIFAVLADLPLSEYIRRRRLTRAAFDLSATKMKVIDAAVKYGYESPDAFAAAFKRLHGVTPTAAREAQATLKAYPKLVFSLILKGDTEMNYRIERKPAFRVAGMAGVFSNNGGEQDRTIPEFWQEHDKDIPKLLAAGGGGVIGKHLLGVCYGGQSDGTFRYMIGVEADAVPEGMETLEIPASTWAVFECVGPMPGAIQALWKRIMNEFLPNSPYSHAGTPDFELYYEGENNENYRSEVWIPVVKK
jgi:AraC family transcriptional regulator